MSKISVIIPTLNEAENIGRLLDHLKECSVIKPEIIVVDGGSSDETIAFAKAHNITVISASKGRAVQMNAGARIAQHEILYFLHADSFPPENYDTLIQKEVKQWNEAGCFRMQFDSSHWWLRLAGWLTKFEWRACRGGDQSQFITKKLFNELGGFDESYMIYEDNDLINKLYERGEFVVIQERIITSARRYQSSGTWKLQYHFWVIYVKKWFGASPKELFQYYQKHIVS
jgi:rSAM/selenodomain-associated transferase 2